MKSKLSNLLYYGQKALQDYTSPLVYKIHRDNCTQRLEEYYFIFNRKTLLNGGSYSYGFDENGIPIIKGHIADTNGNYFYNPQAIGQFALAVYHDYLNHEEEDDKELFLRLSDWFVNNIISTKDNEVVYWLGNGEDKLQVYNKDKRQKLSSMSQSRAISVLLRAYQLTSDEKYMEIVNQAVLAYQKTPEEGGFLVTENDLVLFEESSRAKILNHLIFSIFGLYDYCRSMKFDTELNSLCEQSIASIKKILPNYDTGWWSLYDDYYENGQRRFNPCTRHYHHIHIQQLLVFYTMTQDSYFKEMAKKWRTYDRSAIKRLRMLFHKSITVKKMNRL